MILAEAPELGDDMSLVVDVGTNAEIVLGNRDRLLVCSSPTGPAFEGAQISSGQRATVGAIERVRIVATPSSHALRSLVPSLWSDEPEFAETPKHSISRESVDRALSRSSLRCSWRASFQRTVLSTGR